MDIVLTDEQQLLEDSVGRWLREQYPFATRRRAVASAEGREPAHWRALADMGLLAAPFPESLGGLGGGPLATMIVMREFGRHLMVEPYTETVVIAGHLLQHAGSPEQQAQYLAPLMAGEAIWTLAWAERATRYDLDRPATTARRAGAGYRLDGVKTAVSAAPWADHLIVSARVEGEDGSGGSRLGLFIVDRDAPGLTVHGFKSLDGRRAGEVVLAGVQVGAAQRLGAGLDAGALLARCRDEAIAAGCAEAIGAMTELNAITLDYTKTRRQFGVALGSFQVLQHRMVDMFIALQESVSLMQHLTLLVAQADPSLSRMAAGTKARIGESARLIGAEAVQLHGGMGMTDELNVGHYLKRLLALNIQFGDSGHHLARFAAADTQPGHTTETPA